MESLYFKLWQANRCTDVACTGNPAWNFTNYAAKLVVVNLGSNDGSKSVPGTTFQSHYTTAQRRGVKAMARRSHVGHTVTYAHPRPFTQPQARR